MLYGREDPEVGEGADDGERDDSFDWVVDSAASEGEKRDTHDEDGPDLAKRVS